MKLPDRGYLMVAAAASVWGCWSLFFRPAEAAETILPAAETFIVLGAVLLLTGPIAIKQRGGGRSAAAWGGMVLNGVFNAANGLLFFWAMQQTSLAIAVLSHYLAPVLVALFAPLVLREQLRPGTWTALGLSLGGLALLLEPWRSSSSGALLGACLGAASAVFYAANTIIIKKLGAHFKPIEIQAWQAIPGMLVLLPFAWNGLDLSLRSYALIGSAGLLLGGVGGFVFVAGLTRVNAASASVLTLLEPLVAVLVGVVVWKEIPGPIAGLGALLVVYGAYRVLRR